MIFFVFNIEKIDSNSDKILIYNKSELYDKKLYTIYFKNFNSNELYKLNDLDMTIYSYIINEEKYYATNKSLIEEYTNSMDMDKRVLFEIAGIKIDGVNVLCDIENIMKLEEITSIY